MLGCGVGPVFGLYKRKLHRLGAKLMINPDGLEWKRDKWSPLVRRYLKWSEKRMVKHSDLVICDSRKIEEYIKTEYSAYEPNTTFIAYGADLSKSTLTAEASEAQKWFAEKKVMPNEYYLAVGRFVPENNFQTMLTEFMSSTTRRDFVLITDVKQNQFYEILKEKTGFDQDPRIKFVGTVYDQNLLKFIREHAYGYIHGHEVGGTNPSLLEALASTKMNLLLGVGFNREVGGQGALYWEKKAGSLSKLIGDCDSMSEDDRQEFERKAKERITSYYNWDHIARIYEKCFKGELL
jgi:rhamnosyltransferase